MRITVLAGGVGAARFLRGLKAAVPDAEITVIGNTGDDITLFGLRVCPDLDTVMYTLGGGISEEQGWGRAEESFTVQRELTAYGEGPDWFSLGDRDMATHIVRTRMLAAGQPLSSVIAALCQRWQPGVRLLPMSDDRIETHVLIEDGEGRRSIHFQEWWVRMHATTPALAITPGGAAEAAPAPGVLDAIAAADFIVLPPSNPVVSIGPIMAVPGIRQAASGKVVVGVSPIIGGAPVRGMADACLTAIGVETSAAAVAAHYGADLIGGWLVDNQDKAAVDDPALAGIEVRALPLYMRDLPSTAEIARAAVALAAELRAMTGISITGLAGLPEVTPGADLAELIEAAAPDLRDGDILVVTSKIVSKAEGRILRADDREQAIDAESVRLVAQRGSTRIVETRHGLVLAAAGVDNSNTPPGTVALLPTDPDASARRLRKDLAARLGVRVGVVITDTLGRPWRAGQADAAIGAAGLIPLRDLRGQADSFGNPLEVTLAAVADEIASAADLVKGKTAGVPVALLRGLADLVTEADGPGAAALIRPPAEDMFRFGSAEVPLARRTVREFSAEPVDAAVVRRALDAAFTAPAPHHSVPWRFAVVETAAGRLGLLDAMLGAWQADLRADGMTEEQIARRVRRGEPLRRAPLIIVPCLVTEAAHAYPDERRSAAEREMFLVSMGAAVENLLVSLAAQGLGSCWVSSTMFCRPVAVAALGLPPDWEPMGAIGVGHATAPPSPRPPRDPSPYLHYA